MFQDIAIINEDNLPMFNRCGVMALVAAYLNFLSQMIAVPAFCQHVSKVTETYVIYVVLNSTCSAAKWGNNICQVIACGVDLPCLCHQQCSLSSVSDGFTR